MLISAMLFRALLRNVNGIPVGRLLVGLALLREALRRPDELIKWDLIYKGFVMRILNIIVFALMFLAFPVLASSSDNYRDCIDISSDGTVRLPEDSITEKHMTITDYIFKSGYAFKFTGTSEYLKDSEYPWRGCSSDNSLLVYKIESQKPVYYKIANIGWHEVVDGSEYLEGDGQINKIISTSINPSDLILSFGYSGNCGGCYSIYIFADLAELKLKKRFYFSPAKYQGEVEKLIEYNSDGLKLKEYLL
jgi:hypothetical protein